MERRTKDITRNTSGQPAAHRHRRALAALAAAVVTCGLVGPALAQATPSGQPAKGETGERPQARTNAAKSTTAAPKGDWTRHFTPEERDAWQQKIAAAPDEAERRKLRGQRLAEIQRRTRAQKAEGGAGSAGQPAARRVRLAAPAPAGAAQRAR
jgi:hypothetical protein